MGAVRDNPFKIGDSVTSDRNRTHDGTVVDLIDSELTRVYWRFPLGKVSDHYTSELRWRVS